MAVPGLLARKTTLRSRRRLIVLRAEKAGNVFSSALELIPRVSASKGASAEHFPLLTLVRPTSFSGQALRESTVKWIPHLQGVQRQAHAPMPTTS